MRSFVGLQDKTNITGRFDSSCKIMAREKRGSDEVNCKCGPTSYKTRYMDVEAFSADQIGRHVPLVRA